MLLNLISNGFYATRKRKAEAGDGYEPTLWPRREVWETVWKSGFEITARASRPR